MMLPNAIKAASRCCQFSAWMFVVTNGNTNGTTLSSMVSAMSAKHVAPAIVVFTHAGRCVNNHANADEIFQQYVRTNIPRDVIRILFLMSEERRVGEDYVRTCRDRWWALHSKKIRKEIVEFTLNKL